MRNRLVAVGMLLAVSAVVMTAGQNGSDLYQQGLAREAAGDIKGAVLIFERIVRDSSANRTITAKALIKLGEWSDLLGQDARSYYERVVREFADQPGQADLVAHARARLATLIPMSASTPAGMILTPLPDLGTAVDLLAVAPDGAKAIVRDNSKGEDIALYDLAKKQKRLLTDPDEGWTDFAVWSPDGQRVAYLLDRARSDVFDLRVTTLDGRSTVVYSTTGLPLQPVGWTPDGSTLIVVVRRPDNTWTLGTVPAAGGRFTPLRSLGWSYNRRDATPRLSPDGRFIAYLEGETGLRDVHVVSLDGREAHRITDHPGDDAAPIWSPDGRRLAFTSNRAGSVALWTVEVKDGKPAGQPVKVKDGMQSARLIDWIARGIFYDQEVTTSDLYTMPIDPVDARPTASPRLIPYSRTGRNLSPAWSPDGRLAFISSTAADVNRRYLVVMAADGGPAREFLIPTTTYFNAQAPYDLRWFGDGRGVGFSGLDSRGAPAVFRLRFDTGEWDTIPIPAKSFTVTEWNRDGSAFYFVRRGSIEPTGGIFERAVTGDSERLAHRAPPDSWISQLQFSPDHKWLAFRVMLNNFTERIAIVDVATGESRELLEVVSNENDPVQLHPVTWTPSGDFVVERMRIETGATETLILPVNGGAARPIAIDTLPPSGRRGGKAPLVARWSPDGRSMVLGRVSRGWETFVIENPLAAARAATASR